MAPTPDKKTREKCWSARDKYWSCLDLNDDSEKCLNFRKEYEKLCSKQWVKHFDNKRKFELFKAKASQEGWGDRPGVPIN